MASAVMGHIQVRVYEDASVLAGQVVTFLDEALRARGCAGVFARPLVLAQIRRLLADAGHDVPGLVACGRLDLVDTSETSPRLSVAGHVERARFERHVVPFVEKLCGVAAGKPVHVYGELDSAVSSHDRAGSVLQLQALWTELRSALPFSLLCGYELRALPSDDTERDARSEIELLYDLTSSVNQLENLPAIYQLALATVRRGARSDRAAILLFDADGVMRFKAAHGLSETYQRAVEGHSPWQRDAVAPAPIAVDDTETDPAWAAYRDVFRAEGIRALAFVPLVHQRQLIGKFMLYRDEPLAFGSRELQLAANVAVHVAQAVERKRAELELARAYREEREARLLADEAIRAREEILSVVSHDLRNPLGTILMGATTLLGLDGGERGHRVRLVAERIHRQAQRMTRLIEDLVDFAGIQAGQLAIERKAHKPDEIVAATIDIFNAIASERGLRFEARDCANLPTIDCDSERAVQVMANLVANALKVTPRGGVISIGAEPTEDEVVFFVRDTGPGIDADELPRLFERYWRSKQSQYKGAGLGLSIARGIVDAHGGRIWVESEPGAGATFYFSLASQRDN